MGQENLSHLQLGSTVEEQPLPPTVSDNLPSQSLVPGILDEKRIQTGNKACNYCQCLLCDTMANNWLVVRSGIREAAPGGGLRVSPFLRLHWVGKIPGLSLWHRKDRPGPSDSSIPQRSSIVTRKYSSLYTWKWHHVILSFTHCQKKR